MGENEKKPLIVEIEEMRIELIQAVEDVVKRHKLGCYFIEPTFAELYSHVKASAQNELAQARAQGAEESAPKCACGHNHTK